jgi:ubiquinone/menaquinone biosynthesis C-methylase UbiE
LLEPPDLLNQGADGMDPSSAKQLRIRHDFQPAVRSGSLPSTSYRGFSGPHFPAEFARRMFACEALNPKAVHSANAQEPGSLDWFLTAEQQRLGRHGHWVPRLLEFTKHPGESLLGLGYGLGTDWLQYAHHGASVTVCCPSSEQLRLVRRNFELRSLSGRFLHAPPYCLPLEGASIDVACLSSFFDDLTDPATVVKEIYRVLKPGGKVLTVVPARYDIAFWSAIYFPWQRLFAVNECADKADRCFSARDLRRLFHQFVEHRIHKRHLPKGDIPHIWRWLPRPFLERLMGHMLILKAFKPLSAAIAIQAAA